METFELALQQGIKLPGAEELLEKIEHYKRLGMREMVRTAQRGLVSFFFKSQGAQLIEEEQYRHNEETYELFAIDEEGMGQQMAVTVGGRRGWLWNKCRLNAFAKPVPLEVLKALPDTAKDDAWIFDVKVPRDPILAYHLPFAKKTKVIEYTRRAGFLFMSRETAEKTVKNVSPYYVGLFRWD
jgi:hypothetical protein